MDAAPSRVAASRVMRVVWVGAGLALVAVGAVGLVVPGLPSTVFFVAAAWCFSRSSKRLERWLLGAGAVFWLGEWAWRLAGSVSGAGSVGG